MHYHSHGICFNYPPTWELVEDVSDRQRSITLQTAGASFWTMTLFDDRPEPEQILDSVVQAFQEDYENVDVYSVQAMLLDQPAVAVDLDFFYLDLVNSASLRVIQSDTASILILFQGTDQELEHLREQFEAVTASVQFRDEN